MTMTSLVAARSAYYRQNYFKNGLRVFERGENLLQKLHFCIYVRLIVRNRVWKAEFTQAKNWLFWKGHLLIGFLIKKKRAYYHILP